MQPVITLASIVAAPLFYFLVGLPWAMATRLPWAPLWGVGVMGLTAELAYMGGLVAPTAASVVAMGHLIVAAIKVGSDVAVRARVQAETTKFFSVYLLALLPMALVPFALPGAWGGDWLMVLDAGRHIVAGSAFPTELLARPPLFGAAATPLLQFGSPMVQFQIFCAVASACVLQLFRIGVGPEGKWSSLWILAGSVFFLQITADAWAKFLCAAYLLAAWEALDGAVDSRAWWAGVWLGFALATHQASVLFVPLIFVRLARRGGSLGGAVRHFLVVAALVAVLVAPWEIYTVATYGWEAKLHANPAVALRLAELPPALNAALVAVTTFIAWGPLELLPHWLGAADRFTFNRIAHEAYWIVTATFNSLAGCLLGLVLPWWVALGKRGFGTKVADGLRQLGWPEAIALGLALLGQMALNPYYSPDGSLQTGWVPVGVAVTVWFAREMAGAPLALRERLTKCILWLGVVPWVAFNLLFTAGLVLSSPFRGICQETDFLTLQANGWTSLAMSGFPWLQIALVGIVGWGAVRFSQRSWA